VRNNRGVRGVGSIGSSSIGSPGGSVGITRSGRTVDYDKPRSSSDFDVEFDVDIPAPVSSTRKGESKYNFDRLRPGGRPFLVRVTEIRKANSIQSSIRAMLKRRRIRMDAAGLRQERYVTAKVRDEDTRELVGIAVWRIE